MDYLLLHCKFAHALWRSFVDFWDPLGDVEDIFFSPFCMEEWETFFQNSEYGTNLSNVDSLAEMQHPYF